MGNVVDLLHTRNEATKTIFLPHCTWDKFGDILANNGGRSMGLFDELVSFFATMNMYSSSKMQVSDTKEYQDFLQMYTGKTKTCKTGKYVDPIYRWRPNTGFYLATTYGTHFQVFLMSNGKIKRTSFFNTSMKKSLILPIKHILSGNKLSMKMRLIQITHDFGFPVKVYFHIYCCVVPTRLIIK